MRKPRFTETQIVSILKEAEAGLAVNDGMPEARHQRCDLLPVEIEVRRAGSRGAEANVCRQDHGDRGVARSDRKKALRPTEKREAIRYLTDTHGLSVQRACDSIGLSRSAWYKPRVDWLERDRQLACLLS